MEIEILEEEQKYLKDQFNNLFSLLNLHFAQQNHSFVVKDAQTDQLEQHLDMYQDYFKTSSN